MNKQPGNKYVPPQELRTSKRECTYVDDREKLHNFFKFFMSPDCSIPKYINQLMEEKHVELDLDDLLGFDETGIVSRFVENAHTYLDLCYKALDQIIFDEENLLLDDVEEGAFVHHRLSRHKQKYPDESAADSLGFLIRSYSISIKNNLPHRSLPIRKVKSDLVGKLVTIRGIVTRVSKVKPSVQVLTYICEFCGSETYHEIKSDSFDMLEQCCSEKCKLRNIKGTLCMIPRGSRFSKHQILQLQESSQDVPHGCIPRMMNVECFDDETEKCHPGENVVITGIFMPRMYHGYKKLRAGLLNDTYLHSLGIWSKNIEENKNDVINKDKILSVDELVHAFAPEIYGMKDVKKILLLLLVSSPTIHREDGMKIRGDINILLMGDPGIAKSQLLKTAVRLSKRGIYTTGRGASGVGLTAAVSKDQVTGEIVLEGGALVLADSGICCIDELDKMNENDRTVMVRNSLGKKVEAFFRMCLERSET